MIRQDSTLGAPEVELSNHAPEGLPYPRHDRADGSPHEVIPNHHPIKPVTLHGVLKSMAAHHRVTVEELLDTLRL
jgi:hypothetical protein